MKATELLSKYIQERGFSLKAISNATGLSPGILYPSLGSTVRRPLRADEFLSICVFLQVDPMKFCTKPERIAEPEVAAS